MEKIQQVVADHMISFSYGNIALVKEALSTTQQNRGKIWPVEKHYAYFCLSFSWKWISDYEESGASYSAVLFKSNKIIQYLFFSSESKCIDESLQTMLINSVRSLQERTLTGEVLLLIYLSFYGSVRGIS